MPKGTECMTGTKSEIITSQEEEIEFSLTHLRRDLELLKQYKAIGNLCPDQIDKISEEINLLAEAVGILNAKLITT